MRWAWILIVLGMAVDGAGQVCDAVPGEYLVRVNPRLRAQAAGILRELQVSSVGFESRSVPGLMHVRSRGLDRSQLERSVDEGLLLYAQPNCRLARRVQERVRPSDARFHELWALDNDGVNGGAPDVDINAPEAWAMTTGGSDIVAAVLDGGLAFRHEDLNLNMWRNPGEIPDNGLDDDGNGYVDDVHGANVLEDNGNVFDTAPDGHGSHGAGTIGATGDNGRGVVGVSWGVRLMAISIFRGEDEGGTTADVIEGWEYALVMRQRGVNLRVLNNSFGGHGDNPGQAEIDMANALNAAGIVLVLAAGNDSANNDEEGDSANLLTPNTISVAAVNRFGELAEFSNYGLSTVHLAAPGVEILSTIQNDGYAIYSGTSQAAPIVTGVVALVLSYEPALTPSQVRQLLMSTVKFMPDLEGAMQAPGVVDAHRALVAVDAHRALVVLAEQSEN